MTENGATTQADQSVADLVKQLTDQTSRLARLEVELAKAELQAKGKQAGLGAGMFGGAAGLAFYGLGALIACAILALDLAVAGWLAALIVAVVLFAVAGVMAIMGRNRVKQATPPVPEQATESVKEDVEWAKTRAQSARK
jgi:membrane protein